MSAGSLSPPAPEPAVGVLARRRHVRRGIVRVLSAGIVLCLAVYALLASLQVQMIFPGSATQGEPDAVVHPGPGEEIVRLKTARGDSVVALFGPALRGDGTPDPEANRRPTLLYCYGNGMCLRTAGDEFQRFRRLGLNVLMPEYAGYGMSGGKASEAGCYATADAAYEHLLQRKDVDPARIVAGGWSLGGAVAIDLAARKRVAGLVSFCTFTSLVDMARKNFPFLPARLLLRHRFESEQKIARVTCPILLGHGRRDEMIPFTMADRLAAAARAPVKRLSIERAGHNDFYEVGGDRVFEAVRRFVDGLPAVAPGP